MALRNTTESWGWLARLLHWVIAVMIIFLLGLGWYMAQIVTDIFEQFALVQIHKSWGFTVFVLIVIRAIWRLMNPAPALPDHMSGLERFAAHAGHIFLYALMFAMPISGWLMVSASELQELYSIKNMVFGLFEMPDPFVPGDGDIEEIFGSIHFVCAILMTLTVLGHAAVALKHQFINKDGLLRRMIIGR
ncbi:MAG: cytochrome b [Pseudomonadota bacterium]